MRRRAIEKVRDFYNSHRRAIFTALAILFFAETVFVLYYLFGPTTVTWERVIPPAGEECQPDPLDRVARQPGTRFRALVLHHGGDSLGAARTFTDCHEGWTQLVECPKTPFFESAIYLAELDEDRCAKLEQDTDFVFVTGYKTVSLRDYSRWSRRVTYNDVLQMVSYLRMGEADVLPMMMACPTIREGLRTRHNPGTTIAMRALLEKLGFNESTVEDAFDSREFVRNTYMTTPKFLCKMGNWMRRAVNLVKKDRELRVLFEQDANYIPNKEVSMQTFGTPYYQHHPFVFERLPAFFFRHVGARVDFSFAARRIER